MAKMLIRLQLSRGSAADVRQQIAGAEALAEARSEGMQWVQVLENAEDPSKVVLLIQWRAPEAISAFIRRYPEGQLDKLVADGLEIRRIEGPEVLVGEGPRN